MTIHISISDQDLIA